MIVLEMSILAHAVSDFILQKDKIVEYRYSRNVLKTIFGNVLHGAIVFITLYILLIPFVDVNSTFINYCIFISLTHFLIDLIKSYISSSNESVFDVILFFLDQILHISIIVFLWYIYNFSYNYIWIKEILANPKVQMLIMQFYTGNNQVLFNRAITLLTVYIYVTAGGDIIITKILSVLRRDPRPLRNYTKIKNMFLNIGNRYQIFNQKIRLQVSHIRFLNFFRKKNKKIPEPNINEVSATAEDYKIKEIKEYKKEVTDDEVSKKEENPRGRYIGIVERTIILFLVIGKQFTAITFLITAKSIARYSKMESDINFAEEYLLGTLCSILIAILGGIYLQSILNL